MKKHYKIEEIIKTTPFNIIDCDYQVEIVETESQSSIRIKKSLVPKLIAILQSIIEPEPMEEIIECDADAQN